MWEKNMTLMAVISEYAVLPFDTLTADRDIVDETEKQPPKCKHLHGNVYPR